MTDKQRWMDGNMSDTYTVRKPERKCCLFPFACSSSVILFPPILKSNLTSDDHVPHNATYWSLSDLIRLAGKC